MKKITFFMFLIVIITGCAHMNSKAVTETKKSTIELKIDNENYSFPAEYTKTGWRCGSKILNKISTAKKDISADVIAYIDLQEETKEVEFMISKPYIHIYDNTNFHTFVNDTPLRNTTTIIYPLIDEKGQKYLKFAIHFKASSKASFKSELQQALLNMKLKIKEIS